jgi:hypothetical protein
MNDEWGRAGAVSGPVPNDLRIEKRRSDVSVVRPHGKRYKVKEVQAIMPSTHDDLLRGTSTGWSRGTVWLLVALAPKTSDIASGFVKHGGRSGHVHLRSAIVSVGETYLSLILLVVNITLIRLVGDML